ncbi:MAG: chromosome segregation SMC family protein [Candidatus Aenigmatarchaeota archaeon]
MTRIEKIEMQGFKSFAKKTIINFPSNFSVIAGPNGSGKSNVIDGLCFVLGRTSAKSLRADRMMEMIFRGGKNKPPAEFAKVSLYFDNADKEFPVEDDKLILTRKVNERGISVYKINGRTVTRETVQEVLRPARIHNEGYNIILQGDVTNVIEMSPLERREIMDDISGIAEFDEKRDKAQRELMTVEDRLKESNIVLMEKRSTIERLESERKAAEEYQTLTADLDKLRASLAKQRLEEAEDAMKKLDEKVSQITSGEVDNQLKEADKELESIEKKRETVSNRLLDRSKDIAVIKEVERIRNEITRKLDRIDFNKLEASRIDDLVKRMEVMKQRETDSGVSKAVQEVLKLGRTGTYGTVASLSKVPSEYQTAIEVAAGPHLFDVVVSDQGVAIECVNFLKKNRIGRATFLPLDKIRPRDSNHLRKFLGKKGVIGIALDLVEYSQKYYNAFSFVFGETLIVDKIETARELGVGEARYVTLDGDLVERSGAIIGGFFVAKKVFTDTDDIKNYSLKKIQIEKEILQLEEEIANLNKEFRHISAQEQTDTKEVTEMQKERELMEQHYESLRTKRKALFDEKMNSQEEVNRVRIKKARLEAELENLKGEFENYKKSETYQLSPAILETKIRETMVAINSLGAINMKALEEYGQQKLVYDELKFKVDKLTEERNKILEIMAEIEGRRKDVFTKTLDGVREQFKVVFHDLMGGQADIRLIGGLDSGLIIEAAPVGKKLMNLDLMSGGEKTLTALAYLFAIQRYRPAPFYVLDEIDAALDKPNSKKTVELIKKYSKGSQFIVISHNEYTMQSADCVYGVSMNEGESQIVGIKMPN